MLIYKFFSKGVTPHLVIPKRGGVENQAVDIFIDSSKGSARLYYSYEPTITVHNKKRSNNWLQHECGVLPELFADCLLGGVVAVKVVNNSDAPIVIKINPFSNLSRKHG